VVRTNSIAMFLSGVSASATFLSGIFTLLFEIDAY
jgi:hypothetical protein